MEVSALGAGCVIDGEILFFERPPSERFARHRAQPASPLTQRDVEGPRAASILCWLYLRAV
jgi:hypothetical protein